MHVVQVELDGFIDEVAFYEQGAINLEVVTKTARGSWILNVVFEHYDVLVGFMMQKFGLKSADEVEDYLIPC